MNALIRRQYQPEEFRDLSPTEVSEMIDLCLSRVDYNRFRLARAHGDLASSLVHLARARDFFETQFPEFAGKIAPMVKALGELVPSYEEFGAAMKATRARRITR